MNEEQNRRTRRRSVLLTVAALGAFVCLTGGTVLFSALTDTARTGTNSAESDALAGSADIQLATATRTGDTISCGTFTENLTTGLFSLTGLRPGFAGSIAYLCIRNVGSQSVSVSALADELNDVDFACTGDEELHGDVSCGGNQVGELSTVAFAGYGRMDCQTAVPGTGASLQLVHSDTTPVGLGTLASGETGCAVLSIGYGGTEAERQVAQSDRVTWRAKFTAQA